MKKLLCVFMAVIACGVLYGQTGETEVVEIVEVVMEEPVDPDEPLIVAEEMPAFIYKDSSDTRESFYMYVADSLRLPSEGCQGRTFIQFVVERDSTVSDVRILRGIDGCEGYEAEIHRLLSSMPRWIPGRQGGQVARVRVTMPVVFAPKE